MADIELLIKIPEWVIDKDDYTNYLGCMSEKLYETLKNGTPLDDIKAEIEKETEWAKEHGCYEWLGAYDACLEIIDKYISGKE